MQLYAARRPPVAWRQGASSTVTPATLSRKRAQHRGRGSHLFDYGININGTSGGGGTTYTLSPGGTITFSGTGGQIRERIQIATGNITFSGAVELLRTRTMVPTGDITFSGSATETRIRVIAPTGQITFTGTAPLIDPNAVGGVTTWRTLTGMGN